MSNQNLTIKDYEYLAELKKKDPKKYHQTLTDMAEVAGDMIDVALKVVTQKKKKMEEALSQH